LAGKHPYKSLSVILSWVNGAKLIVERGMTGATGNLYAGLHDFEDMSFLLHLLREYDTFMDIGSNIGSYTILASGAISCNSIAIEPIPSTYEHLQNNIAINRKDDRIEALNIGLGSAHSTLLFTNTRDTVNHVAMEGEKDTTEVPVRTLDEILQKRTCPLLIKIDVEGFETEVLLGGKNTLNNPDLKAVIIELNESGLRYGYKDSDIHSIFLSAGFLPYAYEPFTRQLTELKSYSDESNTIYIRDVDFVKNRIKDAEAFNVLNIKI
jgi:FkbM family methyltransferase